MSRYDVYLSDNLEGDQFEIVICPQCGYEKLTYMMGKEICHACERKNDGESSEVRKADNDPRRNQASPQHDSQV